MKKQIFILILVLAVFANVNRSYGQNAVAGSAPRGTSCAGDPLHPIAGQPYIYKAASNQAGNYTFWATKDFNFISTATPVTTTNMASTMLKSPTTTPVGTDLLATSANYATSNASDNVTITWSDAILSGTTVAAPTFVAVIQDGTCTDNFKAWSITPVKAFTVDIRNMNHATLAPLAYDAADNQCFDKVRGAKYVTNQIEYDFGAQALYFEVIAANFTNSYTPTFQISGLGNGQTATLEWDVVPTFATATAPVAIVNGTAVTSATPVNTNVANTSTGVSIYVRVIIKNNTFQGIASTPITLAVDGKNSVGDWDIDNGNGTTCVAAAGADQKDVATQTLDPRPTVTSVAPSDPFVTGNETN